MPSRAKKRIGQFLRGGASYFEMSGPVEFGAALALVPILISLLGLDILRRSFDTDESQHLHVIWSWLQGLIQYRDVFDNHVPLFHLMFAPIAAIVGERPTILYWMRLAISPAYLVIAWSTYQLGKQLFSRRVGLWAAMGAAAYSGCRFIEFRTDVLWIAFWMLCLTTLIGGRMNFRRALVAGLLFGFCFGVSMKSVLLLLALFVALVFAAFVVGSANLREQWLGRISQSAAFLIGALCVPGTIVFFFAFQGMWAPFRYGVYDFNLLANRVYAQSLTYKAHPAFLVIGITTGLVFLGWISRRLSRSSANLSTAQTRSFVFVFGASYFLLLYFWPPISRTYLTIHPIAAVFLVAGSLTIPDMLFRGRWQRVFSTGPVAVFVCLIAFFLFSKTAWSDRTRRDTELLREVLKLTAPDNYVLDCKGETIFRRRCFFPVLERITLREMERGWITDNVPERCVATQTYVISNLATKYFSVATREFFHRNYLPVAGEVHVAGQLLKPVTPDSPTYEFDIAVPARYVILSRGGDVPDLLDGRPCRGESFLEVGHHVLDSSPGQQLLLVWAPAYKCHLLPVGWNLAKE